MVFVSYGPRNQILVALLHYCYLTISGGNRSYCAVLVLRGFRKQARPARGGCGQLYTATTGSGLGPIQSDSAWKEGSGANVYLFP